MSQNYKQKSARASAQTKNYMLQTKSYIRQTKSHIAPQPVILIPSDVQN